MQTLLRYAYKRYVFQCLSILFRSNVSAPDSRFYRPSPSRAHPHPPTNPSHPSIDFFAPKNLNNLPPDVPYSPPHPGRSSSRTWRSLGACKAEKKASPLSIWPLNIPYLGVLVAYSRLRYRRKPIVPISLSTLPHPRAHPIVGRLLVRRWRRIDHSLFSLL